MRLQKPKEVTRLKNNTTSRKNNFVSGLVGKLFENKVTLLFLALCIASILVSGNSFSFVVSNVLTRFGRNTFMVLALLIPVLAGLGLNFGIVIGAIAAQISLFFVVLWNIQGVTGMLVSFLITTPLAMLFGYWVGGLFNKMKGAEMIGGLILGYFADGLYQLLFLFVLGGIIPVNSTELMIPGGVGVKNTIDLTNTVKYALDDVKMLSVVVIFLIALAIYGIYKVATSITDKKGISAAGVAAIAAALCAYAATYIPAIEDFLLQDRLVLYQAILLLCIGIVLNAAYKLFFSKDKRLNKTRQVVIIVCAVFAYIATYIPGIDEIVVTAKISVLPYIMIFGLCVFNTKFQLTRLGHNMRTVGQSQVVANASGIDVDKTRVIAMMMSTVFAGWGQLIFLQNLGTFATYGAHLQVGLFAIAALLVGGASVQKATNAQAITGVILFHTLFIVAPEAGKVLFDNAMIGEYFRVFVSYGVIALSLAMHAWKRKVKADEPGSESGDDADDSGAPKRVEPTV